MRGTKYVIEILNLLTQLEINQFNIYTFGPIKSRSTDQLLDIPNYFVKF